MGKETVEYSCGHSETVQFYGPQRERDSKKAWMERGVCPSCWKQQKEQERKEANEKAHGKVGELGFVTLTGSEKQIAWANTIRQTAYDAVVTGCEGAVLPAVVEAFNLITAASWWIDHRMYATKGDVILYAIRNRCPSQVAEISKKYKKSEYMD